MAGQKTFEIPELVAAIIRCVPQASLPSVARISRSWSEVALNRIWKNLPALLYLARVVHPLEYSSTTEHWVGAMSLPQPAYLTLIHAAPIG